MSKPNGGPAFPVDIRYEKDGQKHRLFSDGLSIRDYFAAKALQGLLADTNIKSSAEEFASQAYDVADAMLEARK